MISPEYTGGVITMSIGSNIQRIRTEKQMTPDALAERVGVTAEDLASWEADITKPETERLIRLADELGVTVNALVYDLPKHFETRDTLFDKDRMKTYVKVAAVEHGLKDSLKAADLALSAHEGQKRKKSEIPYIYHPLNLACHALAMKLYDDALISACLLHDVAEDCINKGTNRPYRPEELPVSREAQEIVALLTKNDDDKGSETYLDDYYGRILANPKACLVKCLDRCNNLTTMSWGFSREKMFEYIEEVEKYYPQMLRVIKGEPAFYHAAWLLKYQIESMLDIYIRLLQG